MAESKLKKDKFDQLRQQAEERLHDTPAKLWVPSQLSVEEMQHYIHEFQVHQIELETQNEELCRAQVELEKLRDKYSDLYDFAPVGYFTIGKQGKIREANLTAASLLGVERDNLIGKPLSCFITRDSQDIYHLHRQELLETRGRQTCELELKKKGGTPFYAQLESITTADEKGTFTQVRTTITDISERKQAEKELEKHRAHLENLVKQRTAELLKANQQLHQAQKMEAVGTLAGGIAHDFNNLLQAVSGYTQLLLLKKKPGDPDLKKLEKIEKTAQRGADLTKRLLIFSRKVNSELRPVDVNREVVEIANLLERTIPGMIDIEFSLTEGPSIINADSIQLEQIIMNLGVNARDAMPNGGQLTFETEHVVLNNEFCKTHPGSTPGDYIRLRVSDTGHGMAKEILEHIFEPFFTTKDQSKGTGLGLSVVYGIVKSHNGYITCTSEPDRGTTFKIYFPPLKDR